MATLKRDSHFVPQSYLRKWSSQGGTHVYTYPLLVSHANVPVWQLRAISKIAFRTDLYTVVRNGQESDEIERWFEQEFENPAEEPRYKVEQGQPLSELDWKRLAFYAAAQSVRTPKAYLQHKLRMERTAPDIASNVVRQSIKRLEHAARKGKQLRVEVPSGKELLPFRVRIEQSEETGLAAIKTEVTLGRRSWIWSMRHLLTSTAAILAKHRWKILRPADDMEFPTSDHPLICLNYYRPGSFDFNGGWGKRGSEILFPLSPQHLMYTFIRKPLPPWESLTREKTVELQMVIAKHAHRNVFARQPMRKIVWFNPRFVDAAAVAAERAAWKEWHAEQLASETESDR